VVTVPDARAGRGLKVTPPVIKKQALEYGWRVAQPEKVEALKETLQALAPDIIISFAYRKKIPASFFSLPLFGCINIHPSLLPRYRGPAPINWAVIRGETETGISIIKLSEKLDAGEIILQQRVSIGENETAEELSQRLSQLAPQVLAQTLSLLKEGKASFTPQDDTLATYAPLLQKSNGLIKWESSSKEIHNLVRGSLPWPGAFTYLKGKRLKIFKTRILSSGEALKVKPGTVLDITSEGIVVATGLNGQVVILEVQQEGKRRVDAVSFTRGARLKKGDLLE
jgi:methionyl-tRNA formyltransferase